MGTYQGRECSEEREGRIMGGREGVMGEWVKRGQREGGMQQALLVCGPLLLKPGTAHQHKLLCQTVWCLNSTL